MHLPVLNSVYRLVGAMVLSGALAASGWAQDSAQPASPASSSASEPKPVQAPAPQQFVMKDYSKPTPAFPNVIRHA
jgi:hypothetical protein